MSAGVRFGVVGNGGREASIAAMANLSDDVEAVFGLGTNPGVDQLSKGTSLDLSTMDKDGIVRTIDEKDINFLLVGPEAPIIDGLVDHVEDWAAAVGKEVHVLGPRSNAAIERSKVEQRVLWEELGLNEGIEWRVFTGPDDIGRANEHIAEKGAEYWVIKPEGTTGGKGVVLPKDQAEAEEAVSDMLNGKYKEASRRIIIESRGVGPEVSATSLSDGNGRRVMLPFSQDHKRLNDSGVEGKENPNTGGMGAYVEVPEYILSRSQRLEIDNGIGLAQGRMAESGRPYKGFWYEGELLQGLSNEDIRRLEVNVREGDPETQPITWAMIHAGIDVFELYWSAARGELSFSQSDIPFNLGVSAVTLTCAAEGYATDNQVTNDQIYGIGREIEYGDNVHVDYAGLELRSDGNYYTSGGRVLYITGVGNTVAEAAAEAYSVVDRGLISWRGMHVRRSIAEQALRAA